MPVVGEGIQKQSGEFVARQVFAAGDPRRKDQPLGGDAAYGGLTAEIVICRRGYRATSHRTLPGTRRRSRIQTSNICGLILRGVD